jgi:hypothetical protein
MIVNITRGHIDIEIEGKKARIYGEAYLPGHGSPDFVLYSNSFERWDPPHDAESLDGEKRRSVIDRAVEEMRASGMTVEVE